MEIQTTRMALIAFFLIFFVVGIIFAIVFIIVDSKVKERKESKVKKSVLLNADLEIFYNWLHTHASNKEKEENCVSNKLMLLEFADYYHKEKSSGATKNFVQQSQYP